MFNKFNNWLVQVMLKTRFSMARTVELFMVLLAYWWAFVLLLPARTFDLSNSYNAMSVVAGEFVWVLLFVIVGTIQFEGMRRNNKKLVLWGLLSSTVLWLFIGTMILVGAFASTGSGTYLLIALLSASAYLYESIDGK